ncbi:hypothetical protein BH10BAC5_BH10BAC5_02290 [soil metagenome]
MKKKLLPLIIFLSAFPLLTNAQDTLSYNKSFTDKVMLNNLSLRKDLFELELARAEYYRTNNFFPKYPDIDLEYSTDKFNEDKGSNNFTAKITQEIELGGQFSKRNTISGYRIKTAEAELEFRKNEILYNVRSTINSIAISRLRLNTAQEIQQLNEALLASAERRLGAGDISQLEFNLVQIDVNNSRVDLKNLETELSNREATLNALSGLDVKINYFMSSDTSFKRINISLADITKKALENRSDLKALEYEISIANSEASLFRSENIPSLRLSFGLTRGTNVINGDDIQGQHNISKIVDREKSLAFGLGFSLPLPFSGLYNTNSGNIMISEIKVKQKNAEAELIKKQIVSEAVTYYNKLQTSQSNLMLLQTNNELIENTILLLNRGYEKGEISIMNYLTQKQKLYEMRFKYIEALEEQSQAITELERITQTKLY